MAIRRFSNGNIRTSNAWNAVGSNTQTRTVEYLVVAGGGSGGNACANNSGTAGGGGAGGMLTGTLELPVGVAVTITVGGGGASFSSSGTSLRGNFGSDSKISISGVGNYVHAIGGGAGGVNDEFASGIGGSVGVS